jgi:hypothetical protein
MGIRMTQVIGLTKEGNELVKEKLKLNRERIEYSKTTGMFDEELSLYEYELSDGRTVREVVQCTSWSSGLCIFLCLEDKKTGERLFQWTDAEMQQIL